IGRMGFGPGGILFCNRLRPAVALSRYLFRAPASTRCAMSFMNLCPHCECELRVPNKKAKELIQCAKCQGWFAPTPVPEYLADRSLLYSGTQSERRESSPVQESAPVELACSVEAQQDANPKPRSPQEMDRGADDIRDASVLLKVTFIVSCFVLVWSGAMSVHFFVLLFFSKG